ncbi:DNA-processing protein DprA [Bordetella genomosp. 11]|uniref:DNA protecting protein DprA n=1 Tax=Bordetella genomosp. 11 TaxID=1416808 RepID=A0A261ULY0_9BORD|nr:DNA-processing protein DprA [Bordetella genomosp. 11]OZI62886.1 DNA protecting protein DprA [Bordetella genomosp. 11]
MPLDHTPDELAAWLRLSLEPDLGPIGAIGLLRAVGLPEDIYAMGATALARHVAPDLARQLARTPAPDMAALIDDALRWVEGPGCHILPLADPRYPRALLNTADPPLLLYVRGDPAYLARPSLAVVGARSATAGGMENARAFARFLAQHGWCIVSGLAQGVDAAAHEGALDAGPRGAGTVAVMGTGIDRVYPPRHAGLAERIAAEGALVTELPLGSPALRGHFPRRNRLVAGLARGVLVVEAARQSGSLITARLAAENGREVFAIPGSIHSPLSRGCHALIRQGAKLVETARDITDELGGIAAGPDAANGSDAAGARNIAAGRVTGDDPDGRDLPHIVDDDADPVLAALGHDPVHMDTLMARTGLDVPALGARLLALELAGVVARLDGGRFQRLAGARRAGKG